MTVTLHRDGERVFPSLRPLLPYPLDPQPATYTLRATYEDHFAGLRVPTSVTTEWTFRSQRGGPPR